MEKHTISNQEANQRIDKFVRKYLNNTPLSMIYKLFRKKDIKINGKAVKEDYILQEDDELVIFLPATKKDFVVEKEYRPVKPSFKIIYEDDNVLVVSKPMGLLVHNPENKNMMTLTDQVVTYLVQKGEYDPKTKGFIPSPAHRLDRNTSGLVIYGKNMESLQELNNAFKEHDNLEKHYLALVVGRLDKDGKIENQLLKDANTKLVRVVRSGGQEAISFYKPIKFNDKYSLVDVEIKTGRTHQIRVHMSSIGHPVVGDKKYGDFGNNSYFYKTYNWENQFLHAYKLKLLKVGSKLNYLEGKEFVCDLPKEKNSIISKIF